MKHLRRSINLTGIKRVHSFLSQDREKAIIFLIPRDKKGRGASVLPLTRLVQPETVKYGGKVHTY